MNLLVDIGNTRIKWCTDENDVIRTGRAVEHKHPEYLNDLKRQWLKLDNPQLLAISSVTAHQIVEQIIEMAKKHWPNIKILIAKSEATGFSVTNAYQQPDRLGVDRWLGLIALQNYYPGNSCIVDCGTAITIDCLNSHGQHLGGLIAPGLQLMKQSLEQGTKDLSFSKNHYLAGLADSTESAIYTGTLYSAAGLIEKTINDLCPCQTIILTGGDAELLAKHMAIDSTIEPHIVLKGLSLFCRREER